MSVQHKRFWFAALALMVGVSAFVVTWTAVSAGVHRSAATTTSTIRPNRRPAPASLLPVQELPNGSLFMPQVPPGSAMAFVNGTGTADVTIHYGTPSLTTQHGKTTMSRGASTLSFKNVKLPFTKVLPANALAYAIVSQGISGASGTTIVCALVVNAHEYYSVTQTKPGRLWSVTCADP